MMPQTPQAKKVTTSQDLMNSMEGLTLTKKLSVMSQISKLSLKEDKQKAKLY